MDLPTAENPTMSMSQKVQSAAQTENAPKKRRPGVNYLSRTRVQQEKRLTELEQQTETIKLVQLEGLALLKIIRHCDQAVVDSVFGTLCGLARGSTLEITDSFRVRDDLPDMDKFQLEMISALGALGVDKYNVGWYRCAFYNDFFKKEIADIQFASQERIPFSVLLIYDPIATRHGRLAIRAFRLKDTMMKKFKQETTCGIESIAEARISTFDIFEEVPIVLHNHHLIHGFLFELRQERAININCASLAMHNEDDVVDMMSRLGDSIERYRKEQSETKAFIREMRNWKSRRDEYVKTSKNMSMKYRQISDDQMKKEYEIKNPKPPNKDCLDFVLSTTLMGSLSSEMLEIVNNDFFRIMVTKGM